MPQMQPGPHVEEMEAAIRLDGEGLRALLDGDAELGRARLHEAVTRYRASWELAPPRASPPACARARRRSAVPPTRSPRSPPATATPMRPRCARSSRTSRAAP